jgi:hypothetical protein
MLLLFVNIKFVHTHWCRYYEDRFELGHEMVVIALAYTYAMVTQLEGIFKVFTPTISINNVSVLPMDFLNGNGVFKCVKLTVNGLLHLTRSC